MKLVKLNPTDTGRCGSAAGYDRHRRRGEHACAECRTAATEAARTRTGYKAYQPPRCGTYGGYSAHRRNSTPPCEACKAAAAAYRRKQTGGSPRPNVECGTHSGYVTHQKHGTEPCEACRAARKAYAARSYRNKRKHPVNERLATEIAARRHEARYWELAVLAELRAQGFAAEDCATNSTIPGDITGLGVIVEVKNWAHNTLPSIHRAFRQHAPHPVLVIARAGDEAVVAAAAEHLLAITAHTRLPGHHYPHQHHDKYRTLEWPL